MSFRVPVVDPERLLAIVRWLSLYGALAYACCCCWLLLLLAKTTTTTESFFAECRKNRIIFLLLVIRRLLLALGYQAPLSPLSTHIENLRTR